MIFGCVCKCKITTNIAVDEGTWCIHQTSRHKFQMNPAIWDQVTFGGVELYWVQDLWFYGNWLWMTMIDFGMIPHYPLYGDLQVIRSEFAGFCGVVAVVANETFPMVLKDTWVLSWLIGKMTQCQIDPDHWFQLWYGWKSYSFRDESGWTIICL